MESSVLKIIAYVVDAGKHSEYVIKDDAVDLAVFSLGIMVEHKMLEVITAFDPSLLPFTVAVEDPLERNRDNFRALFGFDGTVITREGCRAVNDRSLTQLSRVVYERNDVDITEYGALFVTARTLNTDGKPNPVFWLNGYMTDQAAEEDEKLFLTLRTLCDDHLQRRHTRYLLGRAAGFCPHLAG
jgi:hypothetical protein